MDFYHGGWDGYSDYTAVSELLSNEGYVVEKNYNKRLNEIDLSSYNALLLTYSWNDFSQDELNAIENYVENGGGLLVTVDTQICYGREAPNQVAELFGVHFYGDFAMSCSIVDFNHPITMDKSQNDLFQPFLLWDAAIDRYPSDAVVLVRASSAPFNALNSTSITSPTSESSTASGIAAMVALSYGRGRAVFGSLNGLVQPWRMLWCCINEPNKMLLNTVKWLCEYTIPTAKQKLGKALQDLMDAEKLLIEKLARAKSDAYAKCCKALWNSYDCITSIISVLLSSGASQNKSQSEFIMKHLIDFGGKTAQDLAFGDKSEEYIREEYYNWLMNEFYDEGGLNGIMEAMGKEYGEFM